MSTMFDVSRKDFRMDAPKFQLVDTQYYDYAKFQIARANYQSDARVYSEFHKKQLNGGVIKQPGLSPIVLQEEADPTKYEIPNQVLVFLINRKIVVKENFLTSASKYEAKCFGKPMMLLANQLTTGRELYEEAWMRGRYMLNFAHTKFFDDPLNLWWNRYSNNEARSVVLQTEKQFQPFVIKFVKNIS